MAEDVNKYTPQGPFAWNELGIKKKIIDFLGGMITIGRNHREVHEGEFFTISYTFLAVPNNGFARLRFLTGVKQFHYGVEVISEGKALAKLLRGTTYTADGTSVPAVNNSCASSNVAILTAFHTPTIDVAGSELSPVNGLLILGGTGPLSVGSSVKSDEERIAAVTQDYLAEVQNVSGLAKDITVLIGGYESGTILT